MTLRAVLERKPAIYEIVPPRKDVSRFNTELQGVEDVLHDTRIDAINIPELINRKEQDGHPVYSPATIPPEEYAMLIKGYKESIVNMIAPRLGKEDFLARANRVLNEYGVPNLVVVGKERRGDELPGPGVLEALRLLGDMKRNDAALGGICIFDRMAHESVEYGVGTAALPEHLRVFLKSRAGCDFVTSQITFDPTPALNFLASYQTLCETRKARPLTVFISLTTVPTESILSLLGDLDVDVPVWVKKRLQGSSSMGRESVQVAVEVLEKIVSQAELDDIRVPLGLQVEQVGVNSAELSMELFDDAYSIIKGS